MFFVFLKFSGKSKGGQNNKVSEILRNQKHWVNGTKWQSLFNLCEHQTIYMLGGTELSIFC